MKADKKNNNLSLVGHLIKSKKYNIGQKFTYKFKLDRKNNADISLDNSSIRLKFNSLDSL